jgi:hypothetical protein
VGIFFAVSGLFSKRYPAERGSVPTARHDYLILVAVAAAFGRLAVGLLAAIVSVGALDYAFSHRRTASP